MGNALSGKELKLTDAYWRAANYLSVGQIYLYDNPLLKKPLKKEHVKPRLLGHWGTTPGLNFIYAHLNRVIKQRDLNMIYIIGPGHGGPGIVGNAYMEEPPLIADWDRLTTAVNVIVVPFFISDGLHSYEDIPKLLGIQGNGMEVFRKNPHRLKGRSLYYGKAIGTDRRFADIIIEQTLNARSVTHAG